MAAEVTVELRVQGEKVQNLGRGGQESEHSWKSPTSNEQEGVQSLSEDTVSFTVTFIRVATQLAHSLF